MSQAPTMPEEEIDRLREVAIEHDPDVIAIFVLHGTPERGLTLSGWTGLEGEGAMEEALGLLVHAAHDEEVDPDA